MFFLHVIDHKYGVPPPMSGKGKGHESRIREGLVAELGIQNHSGNSGPSGLGNAVRNQGLVTAVEINKRAPLRNAGKE